MPVIKGESKVWSLERQVRFAAVSLVVLGMVLSLLIHPYLIALSAFVGAGLVCASVTDTCGMAMILARMPWNQAKETTGKANAQFIDVRTAEEYAGGHAPKAVNLPLDALETELSKLDKDKPVYVICQTGRRSQKGAEILNKAGFKDIYNIQGGTSAWTSAGFPIEK